MDTVDTHAPDSLIDFGAI